MSNLIEAYKEDRLIDFTTVCKNELCNKAINMALSLPTIIRAEEFDTFIFKCPHCDRVLSIEFDHKKENSNEISNGTNI